MSIESFRLKLYEGADYRATVLMKEGNPKVVKDISSYTFVCNLLDGEGGSILDTVTVALYTDGTDGKFTLVFLKADLATLIAAGTIPTWVELFATTGTAVSKWLHHPVKLYRAGTA